METFTDLPETKELLTVLLNLGEQEHMVLIGYRNFVYCRRVMAEYYATDGIIETRKMLSIHKRNNKTYIKFDLEMEVEYKIFVEARRLLK